MNFLLSLWRRLTYRRILIAYNINVVSDVEMAWLREYLERIHVIAIFIRVHEDTTPLRIWGIDTLADLEIDEIQRSESILDAKGLL